MSRTFRLVLAAGGALMLALPGMAQAQDGATVSGRVTAAGVPLVGASVFIEELNIGSLTREDGRYTFLVPAARVQNQTVNLTARTVGYRPQTVAITLRQGLIEQNFNLEATPLRLGEVVVTGAGTVQPVERLGTVRNTVSAEVVDRSGEQNIVQALAAKAPNVEITQQSGEAGASSYIRIRGLNTIQGTGQPLFVVDGVPIDNSTISTGTFLASTVTPNRAMDLNPNDIESIEILKGAAAGAIYGARAAQGVILITTRRGRPGATRYSARSQLSWDRVSQRIPLQQRWGLGYFDFAPEDFGLTSNDLPFAWGPELAPGTPVYDHWDAIFRSGFTMDNTLSMSGGSERTTFYLSGNRLDQNGIIVGPNNWFERSTARINASHQFRDDLTVGANVSYADSRGAFIQKGSNISGLMLGAMRSPPDFNNEEYLTPEGFHRSYRIPNPTSPVGSRGYDNPFWIANNHRNTSQVGRAYGNINVDYAATDWITLRYTLGADYSNDERLEALPPSSSDYPTGRVFRADFTTYQIDHNLLGIFTRQLTDNLEGTLTLGHNLNSRRFAQNFTQGFNWIATEGPYTLNNTIDLIPNEFRSNVHTESYLGQLELAFMERLFITGSLRNDGFSTFGVSQRRHWFPRVSAAYVFTDPNIPYVSEAKLRAAIGEAGNEPGVYQTIGAYSLANLFDGGWGPTLRPAQGGLGGVTSDLIRGQDDLGPERTRELEAGFDLGLFGGVADFSATYYNAESRDVIFLTPLAPTTGYLLQARNAARIRNQGVEMSLNLRPIIRADFAWDLGFNWATNSNLVREIRGAEFVNMPGSFFGVVGTAWEGYPLGVLRGLDFARCRYNEDNISVGGQNLNDICRAGNAPEGALYIAEDGFPIADPTERPIMNPNPKWTGSVRSNVRFLRNFQLSGLLDIRHGGQVWNGTRGALVYFGTHSDTEIRREERTFGTDYFVGPGVGQPDGKSGPVVGPGVGTAVTLDEDWWLANGGGFGDVSSHYIEDAGFVKLREVSLSYTMDNSFVRNTLGLSSLDLRIAGRNLQTWTNYSGIDPETNLGGAEVALRGIDYFNNPQTRSFVLTIGLNR